MVLKYSHRIEIDRKERIKIPPCEEASANRLQGTQLGRSHLEVVHDAKLQPGLFMGSLLAITPLPQVSYPEGYVHVPSSSL